MTTDNCFLRLRRVSLSAIHVSQNLGRAALHRVVPNCFAQRNRIGPALLFAQDHRSVGLRDNRRQRQHAILHFRKRADRNLASAAQFVQQRALAGCRRARLRVVQKRQMLCRI